MLTLRDVVAAPPGGMGLSGLSLSVEDRSLTAVVGPSGCGKTSLADSICGLLPVSAGQVVFDGADITGASVGQRVGLGIGYVPARQTLFPQISLRDNLQLAPKSRVVDWKSPVLSLFPDLISRLGMPAGRLPFGLHRVAVFARVLMRVPRLLVMDEPWVGLAGEEVELLSRAINWARKELRSSVLLAGQNMFPALKLADRVYRMDKGRITRAGSGLDFLTDRTAQSEFIPGCDQPVLGPVASWRR